MSSQSTIEPLLGRLLLANISWDGGGDGQSWTDPLNWSNNLEPGALDDVIIGVGYVAKMTNASRELKSLRVDGALQLDNGVPIANSVIIDAGATVRVYRSGILWSKGVTQVDGNLRLGDGPDSNGLLMMDSIDAHVSGTGLISFHGTPPTSYNFNGIMLRTWYAPEPRTLTIDVGINLEVHPGAKANLNTSDGGNGRHRLEFNASAHVSGSNAYFNLGGYNSSPFESTTNNGTVVVEAGAIMTSGGNFSTLRPISVSAAMYFANDRTTATDLNRIQLSNGAEIKIGGNVTLDTPLLVTQAHGPISLIDGGSFIGGTINLGAGADLRLFSGSLHSVTIDGDLSLPPSANLYWYDELSLTGSLNIPASSLLQSDSSQAVIRGIGPGAAIVVTGSTATIRMNTASAFVRKLTLMDLPIDVHGAGRLTISAPAVVNRSLITVDGPQSQLSLSGLIEQTGEVFVRNSGRAIVSNVAGKVGRWTIGTGSYMSVAGTAELDQLIAVNAGATLRIRATTTASAHGIIDLSGLLITGADSSVVNTPLPRPFWEGLVRQGATTGWSPNTPGPAIVSSSVSVSGGRVLALAEATELFSTPIGTHAGQPVSNREMVIRPALAGDVNLDDVVNFDDLLILAQHFGEQTTRTRGDLNDDGTVGFEDLLLLAQQFGTTFFSKIPLAHVAGSPARHSLG